MSKHSISGDDGRALLPKAFRGESVSYDLLKQARSKGRRQQLEPSVGATCLTELRRFERFWEPKYLSLLEPIPEGRHYSGVGSTGAAVILGAVGRAALV
jgi:hypothetical protein